MLFALAEIAGWIARMLKILGGTLDTICFFCFVLFFFFSKIFKLWSISFMFHRLFDFPKLRNPICSCLFMLRFSLQLSYSFKSVT